MKSVAVVFWKEAVMSDTLITKSQYDSLAANASEYARNEAASVAGAASAAIRELAGLIVFTGDVDIVVSQTEPENDNVYWIYFTDDDDEEED